MDFKVICCDFFFKYLILWLGSGNGPAGGAAAGLGGGDPCWGSRRALGEALVPRSSAGRDHRDLPVSLYWAQLVSRVSFPLTMMQLSPHLINTYFLGFCDAKLHVSLNLLVIFWTFIILNKPVLSWIFVLWLFVASVSITESWHLFLSESVWCRRFILS